MAARTIAGREPLYFCSGGFGRAAELIQTLPHVSICLLLVNAGLKLGGPSPFKIGG